MTTRNESLSTAALAKSALGLQLPTSPTPFETAPGNTIMAWPEYLVDAFQRSVLFPDLLRQRGNEEIEITSRPMATVLSFRHELLMDGRSLTWPMHYTLSRIVPPSGIAIDPPKRPVVVVDPRAGQGPAKEDEEFVQLIDVIDCLPPGLFEMVITPRPADVPATGFVTGDWIAASKLVRSMTFARSGAIVPRRPRLRRGGTRLSELNLSLYRTFFQRVVRALANQPMADLALALNPLRLSYTAFGDKSLWMKGMQPLAAAVAAARRPVEADNPLLLLQTKASEHITAALDAYRDARDKLEEQMFFGCYGSPFIPALLGINKDSVVRLVTGTSPEKLAARQAQTDAYAAMLETGFDEALTRAVLYVGAADRALAQLRACAECRAQTSCGCRSPSSSYLCGTSSFPPA